MEVNGVAIAALRAGEQPTLTLTFMVLWFFLVFFRNCLRLPDDMYSVMNMTWGRRRRRRRWDRCQRPPRSAAK